MNFTATGSYNEAIAYAYDHIPRGLHRYLGTDFLIGTDPVRFGLHNHVDTSDGRSYRNTSHACYEYHTIDRRNCVVLVGNRTDYRQLVAAVHELGHILHYHLNFVNIEDQIEVTNYAKVNTCERFAEAWTGWLIPGYTNLHCSATSEFFKNLISQ